METPVGPIPRIASTLRKEDHWGSFKTRWGVGRMHYAVEPGLYALGEPAPPSPVLVTANYKLTFDKLREALPGRSLWILVLDTKGINVWCAAGKGTFGTRELVERVQGSGLEKVVNHRRLIIPQLGGPGISAHQVRNLCGFKVIYGPIRANDLPAFLDTGKVTAEMRRVTFSASERLQLIPMEIVGAFKMAVYICTAFFLVSGFGGPGGYWENAWNHGLFSVSALLSALFAGAVLAPLLLPWLPGRPFSVKGLTSGFLVALALLGLHQPDLAAWPEFVETLAWLLLIPTFSAYLSMNFTGASTYTSLSGVKREMRWAVPLQIATAATGLALWLTSRFIS